MAEDKEIKVSLIMPVYNTSTRLRAALGSALAQTEKNLEIIAVNDGSTDDSPSILRGYAAANPDKIRLIETPNRGAAAARNLAVAAARGKWIYFCDSDDIISPDICKYLVSRAEAENAEIATCSMTRETSDGKPMSSAPVVNCPTNGEETVGRDEIRRRWYLPLFRLSIGDYALAHGYLPLCIFRRDIIADNSLKFTEGLAVHEDETLFFGYLNFVRRAALSDKPLYRYISFENSACTSFFRRGANLSVVEKNYWLRARTRRLAYGKYFSAEKDYGKNLAELYAAELNHLCLKTVVRKESPFWARLAELRGELARAALSPEWRVMMGERKNIGGKKRLFAETLKFGAPAIFLFCRLLSLLKK